MPYFDEALPQVAFKVRKGKWQKRLEKRAGTSQMFSEPDCFETVTASELVALQQEDLLLNRCLKKTVSTSPGQPVGILCFKSKVEVGERVVVPSKLGEQGHNIPWAGHLGYRKTLDWVSCLFYWPSMNKEVQEYC